MNKYPPSYKKDDPRRTDPAARFWNKASIPNATDACWEWMAHRLPQGYGHFKFNGRYWPAHRWAYVYLNGPISKSLQVCHRCDNPSCVRPDHLFLGTRSDNILDSLSKGRMDPIELGMRNAKLTEGNVLHIRRAFAKGKTSQSDLAKHYGVSRVNINYIVRGVTWKHVGGPVV